MFRSGDQIGPYTLVSKLGKGAFGVVWLAERRTQITTTTAAIKIPFDEDIDIEKIKNEADVWVRASGHPNVLPIIEADIYGEHIIIASEYAPGGSLETYLKQHGKAQTVDEAVDIVSGILAGLEHLHSRDIIHRDLKPANILFQGSTPRLADFGISRVFRSTSQSSIVAGTPSYMAPEAFDGKRNEQTDIWSVGVILYQLLAGRLPYDGADMTSLVGAILTRNPEPLPVNVPTGLQNVIARALAKDPAVRYQSAAAMRTALRNPTETDPNFRADKSVYTVQSPKVTSPPPHVYSTPERKSNTPHFVYAIAGLLAAVAIGALLLQNVRQSASDTVRSPTPLMVANAAIVAANNASSNKTPISNNKRRSNSFAFEVNRTGGFYNSDLALIGGYEVSVPSDNQWHDTGITIYPKNQLQYGFAKGTRGKVEFILGGNRWDISEPQPDSVWYEWDFTAEQVKNKYYRVLESPENIKVRSSENNVVIRIDIRQLR